MLVAIFTFDSSMLEWGVRSGTSRSDVRAVVLLFNIRYWLTTESR